MLQQNLILMSQAVNGNSDGSIADDSGTDNELSVRPVRRSTRSTAGLHSNRYNLLMSVLKK